MFFKVSSVLAVTAVSVLASPVQEIEKRAVLTGQFATESVANGRFILENNLWNQDAATSGSQSSEVAATNGNAITWYTTYNWVGGPGQVKSYANLDLRIGLGQPISSISSIPTTWDWSYSSASSGLIADVSYDLWLSNVANSGGVSSTSTFEIMIWLSTRGGADPAGSQIGTANIGGVTWQLFQGTVLTWTVFSFVAPSEITNFNADLLPFLSKRSLPIIQNNSFSASPAGVKFCT
ncbi:hypothetical protein D9758_008717 [Tetrapyrgos nigripes]|uniref:Glycoside hydrolase family 12 protein n=1 Tax=Tetrapyrgos nigripes TaxID=182062 RepID=A0A8H5FXU1_9AGAR|nr:hypothetical protein D9758_008717 [Tetrapyrgos nigripes]